MVAALKVFVSAGTPGNDAQRIFRDAIVRAIDTAGLIPRLMTERDWDYKNPLRGLRKAMADCSGAIVVAYARYEFPSGVEIRAQGAQPLNEISFPTVWNQIEAAMAYEKGLPLLVIAQAGLRADAIFENSHDIRPYWTQLDPTVCHSDGFQGYLRSWTDDVKTAAAKATEASTKPVAEVTVLKLFTSLPWYEGLAVASTAIGLIVAALTIGYRIGSGVWPFN